MRSLLLLIGASALFGVAYTQAPLYYSNQNQYFLHGLAQAGVGELAGDWLANTADPTPVFSGLVALIARTLGPLTFHVLHALLQGAYAVSLTAIVARLWGLRDSWRLRLAFFAAIVVVHSALLRWGSYRLFGWDYPWYFQSGVAGQYVLGGMLQPSVFGVLLLASISAYLWDRPILAVALAAGGAIFHSTYLLAAGMLTLGYMIDQWRAGQRRPALLIGAGAFVLVLPSIVYSLLMFRPTSPEAFAESQRILARVRIPHHCVPALWLDGIAAAQIAWMLLGIFLARGSRLFVLVATIFALSALLTIVQVATDNNTLALLFPWRTSAILVPIATALVLARLIAWCAHRLETPWSSRIAIASIIAFASAGIAIMWLRAGYRSNDLELPLYEYVQTHRKKGDVYLLPVKMPNLAAATRGSLSSDFKPLQERAKDQRIIPIDFQRFRLHTGQPIYVDFKSIPYKDVDVLEWRRRMEWNEGVYKEGVLDRAETIEELKREGVTHVALPASRTLMTTGLEIVYEDANYKSFRLVEGK